MTQPLVHPISSATSLDSSPRSMRVRIASWSYVRSKDVHIRSRRSRTFWPSSAATAVNAASTISGVGARHTLTRVT